MTNCIAALADDRRALILVADRGTGTTPAQERAQSLVPIHSDWWVSAANDASPTTAIIQNVQKSLPADSLEVEILERAFSLALRMRWEREAEAAYLASHGYDLGSFHKYGRNDLGGQLFREIESRLSTYELDASFLVAGFDSAGVGHILGLDGTGPRQFSVEHHSLKGYHAIGNGAAESTFIMAYKGVGPAMPARMVLYYALEGKYFTELSSGAGDALDVAILRHNQDPIVIGSRWVNRKIVDICERLLPKRLRRRDRRKLNRLRKLTSLEKISKSDLRA